MNLDVLLSRAVDLGASDIHLKLGRPPMLRRDGSLGPIEGPDLTESDLEVVLQRVTETAPQLHTEWFDVDQHWAQKGSDRFGRFMDGVLKDWPPRKDHVTGN